MVGCYASGSDVKIDVGDMTKKREIIGMQSRQFEDLQLEIIGSGTLRKPRGLPNHAEEHAKDSSGREPLHTTKNFRTPRRTIKNRRNRKTVVLTNK